MTRRIARWAAVLVLGLAASAGLYRLDHGGEDWMQVAFATEAAYLHDANYVGYGMDGYHDVQRALDRVPLWSPDFARARAWSATIARERRLAAGRRHAELGFPRRWRAPAETPVTIAADGDGADPTEPEPQAATEATPPPAVTVFVTSWCPYCSKLTRHLTELGVAFREVDVERDRKGRDELARKAPFAMGVPVVEVGSEILMGYDPVTTDRLLREAGLLPDPRP